ncbi:TetR/AcrR family transcriptional regulator [Brevibacillus laterosporus]|uniref:TetR family transcriptional regulator n=1 Tax=Brevibacillus laterosporus TaxID=1465 RepID=A0A0F7EGM7_BRELA|nr:TetR family transcriptional regulator [Brevibacillus laterosporus]
MNKIDTYTTIVETAYRLFAENGFEKTSLAMIAKEVGISKPAIYYYFESKEALIDFLFEEICKAIDFKKSFSIEAYTKENFQAQLLSDGYQMIEAQKEDKYISLIFNEFLLLSTRNEKYQQRLHHVLEGFLAGFSDLLTRGAELGILSNKNLTTKAHILTMVFDNIGNYMLMGFDFDYADIWRQAVLRVLEMKD